MTQHPTYPLIPLKNGVHHLGYVSRRRFKRWIPIFIGMSGVSLSACGGSSNQSEIAFKCFANQLETDVKFASVYVVDVENSLARKVSNIERKGDAKISDDTIHMIFKEDDRSFPLEVKINRYTGAATHEHGNEVFGQFASGNVMYEMVCEKIEEKAL